MRLMKVGVILTVLINLLWAEFNPSRFNFGADWDFLNKNQTGSVADAIDYATIWLNDPSFNQYWHGDLLKFCNSKNKTPVFYAYIVAKTSGLGDADVGGKLDAEGGKWLKGNLSKVLSVYENYAQQTASIYGTTKPIIWLMEPDYYQYCNGNDGVSYSEASGYMNQMIAAVKKYLPNALFSLDISPWNNDQSNYVNSFDMSKFTFMHTSGGRTEAGNDRIRMDNNNNVTWSQANSISGKCIIADDGYGTGGGAIGHDATWDDLNNIKNRINNGVVAITQKAPNTNWGSTITSNKSSLSSAATKCSGLVFKKSYTLAVTASTGGKVTKSPDATSYDSGATVTLTATPNSGYKFTGWSGDATGTATTQTLKMTKDMSVAAAFVDVNAKTQFSLTITVTGSGVVKATPDQVMYDSGTTVSLEAFVVNGATFTQWGGAVSGTTNPATLVMGGNKSVTASFTGTTVVTKNLVKNGSFADGAVDWDFGAYETAKGEGSVVGGEFKMAVTNAGTEKWMIQLMQPGITLEKGKKYAFSFKAYGQAEVKLTANIGMPVDPFTSYSKEKNITLTTTKTPYEYTFTMTGATTSDARVEFNGGLATAPWFIDDVVVTEAVEIGVNAPAPSNHFENALVKKGTNSRVVISWYDHAGRLLHSVSGDRSILTMRSGLRFTGSAIAVVNNGGQRTVFKTVNLTK